MSSLTTVRGALVLDILVTIAICHVAQVLGRSSYDRAGRDSWHNMSLLLVYTSHLINSLLRSFLEHVSTLSRLTHGLLSSPSFRRSWLLLG